MTKKTIIFFLITILFLGCKKNDDDIVSDISGASSLSIFFVNDQHGQINFFPRIKYIIDEERKHTNVITVCSGDMFSGNPVVDNYPQKGYPMIDAMNQTGFDVSVLGNHEFDYGEAVLRERMEQAEFAWVCANVDMEGTAVPEPYEYYTVELDSLRVTFLGLVETNGKENGTIPSTHPLRVENFTFERPENVVAQYANIKAEENADLYVALTHIGHDGYDGNLGDYQLADQYPYFDLIIGGHSHAEIDKRVNGIPIFQSGSYLNHLAKIELKIKDKKLVRSDFKLINLNTYSQFDEDLKTIIDQYNESMAAVLDEVIGYSHQHHSKAGVGCFYTLALRERLGADVSFQNTGGVRAGLDKGDISIREVYEFDPFNNKAMLFQMSVSEIKTFLKWSAAGFYYSGIQIDQVGNDIEIRDMSNNLLSNSTVLSVGINDYIPAVYDNYFPENGITLNYTTAEAIIYYLQNTNGEVNFPDCDNYFIYQ
jgi:2',3'-cyclic-nucleotide 2'-phosphodiesterase (5'-nucleotidase family)